MQHDRDYYRAMRTPALLRCAREFGLNREMAVAIAERLAESESHAHTVGCYHFNEGDKA